jgi:pimeloyl-ACP methyl ester carboxylesterase
MDETRRRRVLFVCGFNPYSLCAWNTHYDAVRDFFASAGMDATYFTYTWAECAVSVYARLSGELKRDREYDDIVAHGMGCALVGEYFTRHPEEAGAYGSVVLCMPLITGDNAALALLTHVPFAGLVPLPAGVMSLLTLAAPASAAEMLNVFCCQQLAHVYRTWLPKLDLRLIERPNVHVIYGNRDSLCPIGASTLARARKLYRVEGAHEPYIAPWSEGAFFAALGAALRPRR